MAIHLTPKDIDDIIQHIEKLQQLAKMGAEKAKKQAGSLIPQEQDHLKQFRDYERISREVKRDELLLKSGQARGHGRNLRRWIKHQKATLESIKPSYNAILSRQLQHKDKEAKRKYEKEIKSYFREHIKPNWDKLDIFLYSLKPALDLLDYQIVNQIQRLLNVEKCHIASDKQFADVKQQLRKIKARLLFEQKQQPIVQKPVVKRQEASVKAGETKKTSLAEVPISKLIQQSEGHTLEFKEIRECNTLKNRKSSDILFPPLKTIAGFLNVEGGILLIGVDNSGKIVGIEPYLNTMQQGNNDTFHQQIRNCLRDRFEPLPFGKVKVSFEKFQEGTICRVDVQRSGRIIHLDGKVYVREGNTTQELKGRDLTDWTQHR